jgi:hypothetical protein
MPFSINRLWPRRFPRPAPLGWSWYFLSAPVETPYRTVPYRALYLMRARVKGTRRAPGLSGAVLRPAKESITFTYRKYQSAGKWGESERSRMRPVALGRLRRLRRWADELAAHGLESLPSEPGCPRCFVGRFRPGACRPPRLRRPAACQACQLALALY